MNDKKRCLVCYEPFDGEGDYHRRCAMELFGATTAPLIDISLDEIATLAKAEINQRIAVTGVQPKLSLELIKDRNAPPRLTIIKVIGGFVFKPPTERFSQLPENEDLCMRLAGLCGIRTANHGLVRMKSGELGYLCRRFNRINGRKFTLEDMCQLTETLTENKYYSSVEKVSKAIRKFASNSGLDLIRFYEQLIFSFIIGNADMHLKNYSLLTKEDGEVVLSPAYDLVSTALVLKNDNEESALAIGGKKNNLNRASFTKLANDLNIPPKVALGTITRLVERLPQMERVICSSFLEPDTQQQFVLLINSRAKRLAAV